MISLSSRSCLPVLILSLALAAGLGCGRRRPVVLPPPTTAVLERASRLEAHVRFLAEDCQPRNWERTDNLDKAADYIAQSLRASGTAVQEAPYTVQGHTYRNLIATYGPQGGPVLVIGAYYDACGETPGADDNASGVAALLEIAREFGKRPPAERVDLVAFTLEEPPFFRTQDMGSARHAQGLLEQKTPLRGMIALEMLGRFSNAPGSQDYPSCLLRPFYPDRGDFVAVVGRFSDLGLARRVKKAMQLASGLPVVSINAPRFIPGLDFSDHHPYWDRGFKAVMITDTAFYRNHDYHEAEDTPERLDYRRLAEVVEGVLAASR